MDKYTLNAEARKITGRKVKQLRKEGFIPANIYGKKVKSKSVTIKLEEFQKVFAEAGETGLINLDIKGDKEKENRAVLVANVQMHPVSDTPIHVDFHQVDLKEKVTAEVSVELVGESPAEKQSLGTVVQYIDEVEVEALPTDLPEKFVIDVSKLEAVDQAVFVKDLEFDKAKVEVKTDLESIVVKVEPPQKEEVVETPVAATEEGVSPETTEAQGEAPVASEEGEVKKEEN